MTARLRARLLQEPPACQLPPAAIGAPSLARRLRVNFVQSANKYLKHLWTSRVVESVFRAYPHAEVVLHVVPGVAPQLNSTLSRLRYLGYGVELRVLHPSELADASLDDATNAFLSTLFSHKPDSRHWYSHLTDVLRYALLYKHGGLYLDTDVLTLKPLPNDLVDDAGRVTTPFVGYEDKRQLNGAVLGAPARHAFMRDLLVASANVYRTADPRSISWIAIGPKLISETAAQRDDVRRLPRSTFQPFHYKDASCFRACQPSAIESSFAIHLNTNFHFHHRTEMLATSTCHSVLQSVRVY